MDPADWQAELKDIAAKLTDACRQVDPTSTDQTIKKAHAVADVVAGEAVAPLPPGGEGPGARGTAEPAADADDQSDFAAGLTD